MQLHDQHVHTANVQTWEEFQATLHDAHVWAAEAVCDMYSTEDEIIDDGLNYGLYAEFDFEPVNDFDDIPF